MGHCLFCKIELGKIPSEKIYNDERLFHMAKDPLEKSPLTKEQDHPAGTAARAQLQRAFQQLGLAGQEEKRQ